MFNPIKVKKQFEEECTACGLCVEGCPIVSNTELKGIEPKEIIREVLDLFLHKKIGNLARRRIYSCLYRNMRTAHCPQALIPAHAFAVGKAILQEIGDAIPGIRMIEMENTHQNALCCGAYAINGAVKPGLDFRDRRLRQAKDTGADILGLYCPGCQTVLAPEGPNLSLRVESILTLLGESLGII